MYRLTVIEDQQKFIVPLNELSEKLYYNQRMLIDTKVDVKSGAEPRAWKISKINRINSNGTVMVTLAQDMFNIHTDYVEYEDENDPSTIIGMWADYYSTDGTIPSEEKQQEDVHSVISYIGNASIKVGSGYKKFTVNFFDGDKPIDFKLGQWNFTIDGDDASTLITTTTEGLNENQIKVKFIGSESYVGKTLKVSYVTNTGIESNVDVLIAGV